MIIQDDLRNLLKTLDEVHYYYAYLYYVKPQALFAGYNIKNLLFSNFIFLIIILEKSILLMSLEPVASRLTIKPFNH